jgi:hypothetical protein
MNASNPALWAGLCAGGYFAAAAVYVGNVVALAVVREDLLLTLVMVVLPAVCVLMGRLVIAGKAWAPRWAVVVAAGFSVIHLVGLVYLFLLTPASVSIVTRALQWQLGCAFVFLWLIVLSFAFRLAKGIEASPNTTVS